MTEGGKGELATDEQLRALRREAWEAGDAFMVTLCDRKVCSDAIREAQARAGLK